MEQTTASRQNRSVANCDLSWPCSLLAKLAAHVSLLHYCLLTLDSRNPIPTYRVSSILGCVKEAIKEFIPLPIGLNSANLTYRLVELGNLVQNYLFLPLRTSNRQYATQNCHFGTSYYVCQQGNLPCMQTKRVVLQKQQICLNLANSKFVPIHH